MKKRDIGFLIFALVVGFAAISATLVVNGNFLIGSNPEDFDVYFSEAFIDNVNKSNSIISDNKKTLTFSTKELTLVGDSSTLEFEVTNNSRQYDAEVNINCIASSPEILNYITIEKTIDKDVIPAKSKAKGTVKATLTKAYTAAEELSPNIECKIGFNATSKDEANDTIIKDNEYYTYGYLLKDGNPVTNATVLLKSPTQTITKVTDERSLFIFDSLMGGDYDLYIFDAPTESDFETKTDEELKNLASEYTTYNTGDETITLTNYEIDHFKTNLGTPVLHTLTLNPNGGIGESLTSTVIEGEPLGYLPTTFEHDTLVFDNWQNSDEIVDNNTVVNGDLTLNAAYGEGIAKIGEKHFDSLNKAFNYVSYPDETTIDVLKRNTVTENITTDKNIILNLNENTVNMNDKYITSTNNLTIKNGTLESTGDNLLINSGTLNLTDNFTISHDNTLVDDTGINLIINENGGELSITDATINASSPGLVGIAENCLKNDGTATINNMSLNMTNMHIKNESSGNITINNSSISNIREANTGRGALIGNYGIFSLDETTISFRAENIEGSTLISNHSGSTLNVSSGVIDNTFGTSNAIISDANSLTNLGSIDKNINIVGNGGKYFLLAISGNLNIPAGTLNLSKEPGIGISGTMTVGTNSSSPTINYYDSIYPLIQPSSNSDKRIINANINIENTSAIDILKDAKLTIDNINLVQSNSTTTNRAISVTGELVINGGSFKTGETNEKGYGLISTKNGSTLTINGGTYDNTYGKANLIYADASSILNIGAKDKTINFIGNNQSYNIISSYGKLNILDGTINISKGIGIGNYGTLTIGTETTTPTINHGNSAYQFLTILSPKDNRIINANINIDNMYAINVYKDNKLTIDNVNLTISNSTATDRAIGVTGNLTINGGTFTVAETNTTSMGLIKINSAATVTINGGTFDNSHGTGNSIYTYAGSTLNMGSSGKDLNIIGVKNQYTIITNGTLNIPDGNFSLSGNPIFYSCGSLHVGTTETSPTFSYDGTYSAFYVNSNNDDNIITNANINTLNGYAIKILESKKLTIDNINLIQANRTSKIRAIINEGELTINDGYFKTKEDNAVGYGLLENRTTGTMTVNGGVYDNTYGKAGSIYLCKDSTNYIGAPGKTIDIIGNSSLTSGWYTLYNLGTLDIKDGTINFSNGNGIINQGTVTIGSPFTKPSLTQTGEEGLLDIKTANDNKIINGNINLDNSSLAIVNPNCRLTIENIELNHKASTSSAKFAILVSGELVINNGLFKISEDNTHSPGIINIANNGIATLNGGTYDSTYSASFMIYATEKTTLNIGAKDNTVKMIGINKESYDIYDAGNLNIADGIIEYTNGKGIYVTGTLTIGSETSAPKINHEGNKNLLVINSNNDNKIINADIKVKNAGVIYTKENSKITIENINLSQSNNSFFINVIQNCGEMIINNGNFTLDSDNTRTESLISNIGGLTINNGVFNVKACSSDVNSYIISLLQTATVNINGGHFIYEGNAASIGINGGILNIGKEEVNPILIENSSSEIINIGALNNSTVNVYSGTLKTGYYDAIFQGIFEENGEINCISEINIIGGHIENNAIDYPTIYIEDGNLNMSGGEIINNGGGYTIYAKGGTATQSGGTSANNYGVTVEQPTE